MPRMLTGDQLPSNPAPAAETGSPHSSLPRDAARWPGPRRLNAVLHTRDDRAWPAPGRSNRRPARPLRGRILRGRTGQPRSRIGSRFRLPAAAHGRVSAAELARRRPGDGFDERVRWLDDEATRTIAPGTAAAAPGGRHRPAVTATEWNGPRRARGRPRRRARRCCRARALADRRGPAAGLRDSPPVVPQVVRPRSAERAPAGQPARPTVRSNHIFVRFHTRSSNYYRMSESPADAFASRGPV